MTDKQIIIDGCDVSGCDFLAKKDDYCSYSGVTYAYKGQCMCSDEQMCKEHPKCFYKKVLKQLKRKEQECEELKKIINEAKNSKLDLKSFLVGEAIQNEYEQQLDQLKAENEELKKDVIEALKLVEITSTHNTFQETKINRLSKTLTEIKKLIQRDYCTEIGSCEFCAEIGDCLNRKILQKISEVEDEKIH